MYQILHVDKNKIVLTGEYVSMKAAIFILSLLKDKQNKHIIPKQKEPNKEVITKTRRIENYLNRKAMYDNSQQPEK